MIFLGLRRLLSPLSGINMDLLNSVYLSCNDIHQNRHELNDREHV